MIDLGEVSEGDRVVQLPEVMAGVPLLPTVQLVAVPAMVQDKEVEPPVAIEVGLADKVTLGGGSRVAWQLAVFEIPELVTSTVAFFTPVVEYVEVVDWVEPLASPDQRYVYDPLGGVEGLTDASQRIVLVA